MRASAQCVRALKTCVRYSVFLHLPQARKHATFSPYLCPSFHDALQMHCPARWGLQEGNWTLPRFRALNFFFLGHPGPGHPVGDQLVTALHQAQVEAVVPEGRRKQSAWVDLERQLQNMTISYLGGAVQRGLD